MHPQAKFFACAGIRKMEADSVDVAMTEVKNFMGSHETYNCILRSKVG